MLTPGRGGALMIHRIRPESQLISVSRSANRDLLFLSSPPASSVYPVRVRLFDLRRDAIEARSSLCGGALISRRKRSTAGSGSVCLASAAPRPLLAAIGGERSGFSDSFEAFSKRTRPFSLFSPSARPAAAANSTTIESHPPNLQRRRRTHSRFHGAFFCSFQDVNLEM